MQCPQCHSSNLRKDGHQNGKQRFECKDCGRLFRESYEVKGYHSQVKKVCLKMYLNGMGLRAIERVTGIHHTTILNWVKETAQGLPEDEEDHPTVAELDELQTYVGRKTDKVWLWTAINHHAPGILAIEVGDRSGQTFALLWQRIQTWKSRRYLTDGYCVYANYINPENHLVLPKILLTRVEGENTRLRHYLARLHRATLCYSKSRSYVALFGTTINALFKISDNSPGQLIHCSFSNAATTGFKLAKLIISCHTSASELLNYICP